MRAQKGPTYTSDGRSREGSPWGDGEHADACAKGALVPASTRPYMGAIPYSDASGTGVTFRVWAPFASYVAVAGAFNGWRTSASPLYAEGNDFGSVDVPAATAGSQYKFVLSSS